MLSYERPPATAAFFLDDVLDREVRLLLVVVVALAEPVLVIGVLVVVLVLVGQTLTIGAGASDIVEAGVAGHLPARRTPGASAKGRSAGRRIERGMRAA